MSLDRRPRRAPTLATVAALSIAVLFAAGCGSDATPSASSPTVDGTVVGRVAPDTPVASNDSDTSDTGDKGDTADTAVTSLPGELPQGFTTVEARVTAADGEVCEVCLWLADTDEERGRGLMGVTDLGLAGGMAFVFDPATTGAFYMFQTPTPLSIAWFGEDGGWVGSADMAPCMDATSERCALYSPDGAAYTVAVETFDGDLEALLLVEGSTIELLAGSEQLECQTPSS